MSEAVMQHGAMAPPTGGGVMRRLNLGTAVGGGLCSAAASPGWLAHHFLQTDEPTTSDQVVTHHDGRAGRSGS